MERRGGEGQECQKNASLPIAVYSNHFSEQIKLPNVVLYSRISKSIPIANCQLTKDSPYCFITLTCASNGSEQQWICVSATNDLYVVYSVPSASDLGRWSSLNGGTEQFTAANAHNLQAEQQHGCLKPIITQQNVDGISNQVNKARWLFWWKTGFWIFQLATYSIAVQSHLSSAPVQTEVAKNKLITFYC